MELETFLYKLPPPKGYEHLSKWQLREEICRSRGIALRPELWPSLVSLYSGWLSLGRDINGVTLYGERVDWLDRNWPAGEREAGEYLMAVLESASAEIHNKHYPPPKKGS